MIVRCHVRSLVVRTSSCVVVSALVVACAAGGRDARAPASSAPAGYAGSQNESQQYPQQPGAYPQQPQQPGYPAPPPAEPSAPSQPQPGQVGGLPGQPGAGGNARTMAFSSALDEVDSSQRQLDVAAGDCNNACRALGSMDRAAGRLCSLAQGNDEGRRCDDAKKKVYSARDRVKQTCGACPGGVSVDRSAPVPSVR